MTPENSPFRFDNPLPRIAAAGAVLNTLTSRLLALEPLERLYSHLDGCNDAGEFAERCLASLGVSSVLGETDRQRIPAAGPAVIVANHPYGGLEGLLLIQLLLKRRADVRLLANRLLWRIPELRSVLIPVDVLDSSRKTANIAGLRAAMAHVKSGGMLALFPAGAVSHLHWDGAQVVDPTWSSAAARLIRKCHAPVTPMYFDGRNSVGFQLAGLIHPLLRTALLPRELVNKRHHRIGVSVGAPIPAQQIEGATDDVSLASLLRLRTYGLAEPRRARSKIAADEKIRADIAPPLPAALIAAELDALPAEQQLLETAGLKVVVAQAAQLPWSLQDLGRLREITFRAAGEGTGRARDVDLFDNYYDHLICWNSASGEIVGAYRIGAVDRIVERYGVRGLYTRTLFKYGREFATKLGAALELGRSFVRPEYQRSFTPLLALWRGISAYVARHPQYRVLFGPVSISNDYLPASRFMLVEFLKRHCFDAQLAKLIKPRAPVRRRHPLASLGQDFMNLPNLDTLSELVTQLEPDGKDIPVLLRQYLKLGGKLLGFNVDAAFGQAIDGLIVVDLPNTDLKTLQRYMGREQAARYLAAHRRPAAAVISGSA